MNNSKIRVSGLDRLLARVEEAAQVADLAATKELQREVRSFLVRLSPVQPTTEGLNRLKAFARHNFQPPRVVRESPTPGEESVPTPDRPKSRLGSVPRQQKSTPTAPTPLSLSGRRNLPYTPPRFRRVETQEKRDALVERAQKTQDPTRNTFRTLIEFEQRRLPAVQRILDKWLSEKSISLSITEDGVFRDEGRYATTTTAQADGAKYSKLSTVEEQAGTHFDTEVVVADTGDGAWLWVDITTDGSRRIGTPRFVRELLTTNGELSALGPSGLGISVLDERSGVDDLIAWLTSAKRHQVVFVAATDRDDEYVQKFRRNVGAWSRHTVGLATFVLLSPDATDEFESRVPPEFGPRRWSIRTYFPGLDVSDPYDARRHRFFGSERFAATDASRVAAQLGAIARSASENSVAPPGLREAQRVLSAQENLQLLAGLHRDPEETARARFEAVQRSHSSAEDEKLGDTEVAQVHLLKSFLEVDAFTEEVVLEVAQRYMDYVPRASLEDFRSKLSSQLEMIEDLKENLALTEAVLEESEAEMSRLVSSDQILRARVSWLQKRLDEAGQAEAAYSQVFARDQAPPANFEEILDNFDILANEQIIFTGNEAKLRSVDIYDTGTAASMTWSCLCALSDYLKAKSSGDFHGNVHEYLANAPVGYRTVPQKRHAPRESGATMNSHGTLRMFPVPASVSSNAMAEMQAHFKLAKIGMRSPRMHYLDNSHSDGRIYIGYIGDHLRTVSTN